MINNIAFSQNSAFFFQILLQCALGFKFIQSLNKIVYIGMKKQGFGSFSL